MRSFNATKLFGFILVLMAYGPNLQAEPTGFLGLIILLNVTLRRSILLRQYQQTAGTPSRFVNSQWQTEAESEDRLNRLVEKLIAEEYSPYDIDTCIEQEFVTQRDESSKRQLAGKHILGPTNRLSLFHRWSTCVWETTGWRDLSPIIALSSVAAHFRR